MSLIATLFPELLIPHLERVKREWEKMQTVPVFKSNTERSHSRDETTNNVLLAVSKGIDLVHDIAPIVGKQPNTVRAHLASLIQRGLVVQVLGSIQPGSNRRSRDRFYLKQQQEAA